MKKLILVLVLFSFFFTNAQIEFIPGVKAGLNVSDITNSKGLDNKTDFYIGAFGTVKFVHFYNLQPEIIYSRQGADNESQGTFELDYLSITIANKFYPFKDVGFHVIIGPSFDIKINDNFESNGALKPEGFDFAMIGGLGFDFPFGLGVEARFKRGFVDIFGMSNTNINIGPFQYNEYSSDSVGFNEQIANQVFQIGITYQFDL